MFDTFTKNAHGITQRPTLLPLLPKISEITDLMNQTLKSIYIFRK